jgi:hypothetical protein
MAAKKLRRGPAIVTSQKPDQPSDLMGSEKEEKRKIVNILEGYRTEAEYARLSGPNSRDQMWMQHLDLYWNRFDYSKKAAWPSRDGDDDGVIAKVIRKLMTAVLRRIGRSPTGQPEDFTAFFEDAMKMGALSMCSAIVTSKSDGEGGNYTAVDLEDPYNVWLDMTGRNLYRIRRVEMDLHEFLDLMDMEDDAGLPLYDRSECMDCYTSSMAIMLTERQKRTGTGQWSMSNRRPIVLHEYYCTLIDEEGKVVGKNVLCVVANNTYLVRGPEENPFWHGQDWLSCRPIISVPLAPYGKSYAENFAQIARTFNELTNLILDAIQTSAMKIFVATPGNLEDPSQLEEGIFPNALLRATEGVRHDEILTPMDMGTLNPEVMQIWAALKKELQEGAAFNEMTLGQSAPKGRTSATEVNTVSDNSTSYIRSIAANIEHWLETLLDLIWKTTIQHLDRGDEELKNAVGEQWFDTLYKMKKKFAKHKISFVCRGISGLLQKKQKLQDFMQFLQVIASSPALEQWFQQQFGPDKTAAYLADLMDVELDKLSMSPREKMLKEAMDAQQQQQAHDREMQLAGTGPPQAPQTPQQPPPQEPGLQERLAEEHGKVQMKTQAAIHQYQEKKKADLAFEHMKPKPPPRPVVAGAGGGGAGGATPQPQQAQPAPQGQGPR